jgi:polar amino acid transport system substrate-binding protein
MKVIANIMSATAAIGVSLGIASSAFAAGAASPQGTPAAIPAPATIADAIKLLPKDVRDSHTVPGAAAFDAKPMSYYAPDNKPAGVIVDLLNAAAGQLGLKIAWRQIPYSGLVPALESRRILIAGSQISKTPQVKGVVNLLAIYKISSSLLVKKGVNYPDRLSVCGSTVGVPKGSTINKHIASTLQDNCSSHHKAPVQILYFTKVTSGITAVRSGRVDSFVNSTPQLLLATKMDPNLNVMLMGKLAARDTGIAFPKEETGLMLAFQRAMDELIANGDYAAILKKYDLYDALAIPRALVNDQIPMLAK